MQFGMLSYIHNAQQNSPLRESGMFQDILAASNQCKPGALHHNQLDFNQQICILKELSPTAVSGQADTQIEMT